MKFRSAFTALHAVLLCILLAASPAGAGSMALLGAGKAAASGGGCSQATAFLARNGNAHPTETTTLICGLVSDGDFANLDVLYIFATDTSAHALLNLVSTSFTATITGSVSFTANQGFTGPGAATSFIDSGYVPSVAGLSYAQNSASIGYYCLTNSTAVTDTSMMGINDGTNSSVAILQNTGGSTFVVVNDNNFAAVTALNHQGMYVATRTASNAIAGYRNSSATAFLSSTGASSPLSAISIFITATNQAGSALRSTTDQVSAAFIGGGLTSAASVRISDRINAYMTSLTINVY